MLSLSDLSFSGGGDDEGSAAANSVMHVLADGDCGKQTHQSQVPLYSHLEGTGSSVGTAEGLAGARMVSRILLRVLLILFRIRVSNVAWDKAVGCYKDKDEEPSVGSNRGTKQKRSGKEESSKEVTQKESKSTSSSKEPLHQEFNIRNDVGSPVREIIVVDERLWNPSGSQTPDREWNKTKTIDDRPPQSWMTQLAQASGTQSSFNEFLATPIDFSAFIMNRLKLNNLTQDVLTGPTYDLMKGTCKSVVELEYHLEEVFKATNDQLDWHNPEGRPYPYDLSKPLPLI
ncbi:hypothetical protein Tco_1017006 [Tanacetum coccineum]|uniref:Uncharacterized protein n=1 Tax=Tanacetum coccineum TaxID=301880 RepID=A0ABQ5FQA6_9ASTR